jgi:hypothetical protein
VTEAEDIKDGKDLDKSICLKIIPVGFIGIKEFFKTPAIRIVKKIGQVFTRISLQKIIFYNAVGMKTPGIRHFCQPAIIETDPSVKYPGHDFEQEDDDQLGTAKP